MRIRGSSIAVGALCAALALLWPASGSLHAEEAPATTLVLAGGTVIDVSSFGSSQADIKDSVIVLRDGQIVAAGPRKDVKIPAGARVIDISGKYVVPGLNDAFSTLNNQAQANAHLYMGVTSIVGLGEPPGGRRGPLFLDANPSPRIYRLEWEWSPDASMPEPEVIKKIEALSQAGVKVLLLHYGMSPEQVRVTARRARELGMATIGEFGLTTYAEGVEAGVNALVHTSRYSLDLAPPELRKALIEDPFGPHTPKFFRHLVDLSLGDPAVQRHAAVLASGRVGLIPTASMRYLTIPGHENPWKEPIAAILDPKDIHLPADPSTGEPADARPLAHVVTARLQELDGQYRKAGAKFLAGSGADAFGTMPGISLHTELQLLTRIGLTPRQALAAATSNLGELFGWSQIGQVKAGFNADLLVLDANPVEDISHLKKIHRVVLNGEMLDRDRLLVPPPVPAQDPVVIKGGTLIDVHTGAQITDSLIVVEGSRIKQVGKASDIVVPRGARVIDVRDKWIIPGLMDMHAHIAVAKNLPLELFLANGVTTIQDPGGDLTLLRLARQEIDSGKRPGPRLFFAGYVLDGNPPLWPEISIIADTEERAESATHFLIDQGVDAIKVYNSMTEPALVAIIRTAHSRGIPVIGHVPRSMTMTRAVELGLDGLEHIRVTGRELLPLEEADKIDFLPFVQREALLWQRFDLDSDKMKELVSFLAERKVFLNPTLTVDELSSLALYEEQAKDPNNRFMPRDFIGEAEAAPDVFRLPPELKDAAAEGFRKRLRFIGMCGRAGVQILAGTDGIGTGTLLPGFGLQHELELLAQAGLTPIQVLQAATINGARALKKDRELGSIEAGKFADLVILSSSPLADIRNASKIEAVMAGGRLLDRKALDEMLAQAEASARKN
jgi:imidazolonepropionase-like amidohydrolase